MPNESPTRSYISQKKKSIDRSRYSDQFIFSDIKQRKFRWSSCFSFVSKLKKPKSTTEQQIRVAQSYEDIATSDRLDTITKGIYCLKKMLIYSVEFISLYCFL